LFNGEQDYFAAKSGGSRGLAHDNHIILLLDPLVSLSVNLGISTQKWRDHVLVRSWWVNGIEQENDDSIADWSYLALVTSDST
jgi:hypothetical protein